MLKPLIECLAHTTDDKGKVTVFCGLLSGHVQPVDLVRLSRAMFLCSNLSHSHVDSLSCFFSFLFALWQETGKLGPRMLVHHSLVTCLLVVGHNLWSASFDRTIRVFSLKTRKVLAKIEAHSDAVVCLTLVRKRGGGGGGGGKEKEKKKKKKGGKG